MPLFYWRGVTKNGHWRSGRTCAISRAHLEQTMLHRGIAVTAVSPRTYYWFLMFPVPLSEQARSLETVAMLLESGIRLDEACVTTAEIATNRVMQEFWVTAAALIQQGKGLDENPYLIRAFKPLIVQLLLVGYRAGTLAKVARVGAWYGQSMVRMKQSLWQALLVPLITIGFVGVLLWGIFVWLIPSMITVFSQWHAALPHSIQVLLEISAYVRNPLSVCVVVCIGIAIYGIVRYCAMRGIFLYTYIPYIGSLYEQWYRVLFAQALYALLDGGITLPDALNIIAEVGVSPLVRVYAARLAHAIEGGTSLSVALATHDISFVTPLMIAMVTVGEETNALARSLKSCAEREYEDLLYYARTGTMLLQPVLIIGLGLVVLAVIVAVYMPLINIAQIVQ